MNRILDLNEEERRECLEAYTEEFRLSKGGAADVLYFQIRLRSLGLDASEIDSIVKENRPSGV